LIRQRGELQAFGRHDHARWYGNDYPKKLCKVDENNYVESFHEKEINYYGLDNKEIIYYSRKN